MFLCRSKKLSDKFFSLAYDVRFLSQKSVLQLAYQR